MDRFYKTKKNSETGLKLQAIVDRMSYFDRQLDVFIENYKIHATIRSQMDVKGICGVDFKGEYDQDLWKKNNDGTYAPRKRVINKDRKEDLVLLNSRWDMLRKISIKRWEIDNVWGGKSPFLQGGFSWANKDYFLFFTSEPQCYVFPPDCVEITNIEYSNLVDCIE